MSRDVVAVATLLGTFFLLQMFSGVIVDELAGFLRFCMELAVQPAEGFAGLLPELTVQAIVAVLICVGPLLAVCTLCAVAATFAQTRFLVTGESMKPKFSRINPLQGFKRLFSLKSVIEALKGILKITILVIIIYQGISGALLELSRYLYTDVPIAAGHIFELTAGMVMQVILAFIVLAGFDVLYQWWDYERNLKMSKQEVKEEYKQMEGDPKVKGKIREIQRKMVMSRMMQKVPQADVVVRNPTHYAVALRYKPDQDNAPVVLAKGQNELALRIVRVAEENQVAVMENVPLARALYAQAELDREIPPALYGAVAEVLVYIFKLNGSNKIVK